MREKKRLELEWMWKKSSEIVGREKFVGLVRRWVMFCGELWWHLKVVCLMDIHMCDVMEPTKRVWGFEVMKQRNTTDFFFWYLSKRVLGEQLLFGQFSNDKNLREVSIYLLVYLGLRYSHILLFFTFLSALKDILILLAIEKF